MSYVKRWVEALQIGQPLETLRRHVLGQPYGLYPDGIHCVGNHGQESAKSITAVERHYLNSSKDA